MSPVGEHNPPLEDGRKYEYSNFNTAFRINTEKLFEWQALAAH